MLAIELVSYFVKGRREINVFLSFYVSLFILCYLIMHMSLSFFFFFFYLLQKYYYFWIKSSAEKSSSDYTRYSYLIFTESNLCQCYVKKNSMWHLCKSHLDVLLHIEGLGRISSYCSIARITPLFQHTHLVTLTPQKN